MCRKCSWKKTNSRVPGIKQTDSLSSNFQVHHLQKVVTCVCSTPQSSLPSYHWGCLNPASPHGQRTPYFCHGKHRGPLCLTMPSSTEHRQQRVSPGSSHLYTRVGANSTGLGHPWCRQPGHNTPPFLGQWWKGRPRLAVLALHSQDASCKMLFTHILLHRPSRAARYCGSTRGQQGREGGEEGSWSLWTIPVFRDSTGQLLPWNGGGGKQLSCVLVKPHCAPLPHSDLVMCCLQGTTACFSPLQPKQGLLLSNEWCLLQHWRIGQPGFSILGFLGQDMCLGEQEHLPGSDPRSSQPQILLLSGQSDASVRPTSRTRRPSHSHTACAPASGAQSETQHASPFPASINSVLTERQQYEKMKPRYETEIAHTLFGQAA